MRKWWPVANPQFRPQETESRESRSYEFLDHTADVGVRAWGNSLPELFVNVVRGMIEIMVDVDKVVPRVTRQIDIEAEDRESLLMEWLNETIYLIETENLIFCDFRILHMTDTRLSAQIAGEPLDETKQNLKTQVKAATYHDLRVGKDKSTWFAQVILDV